jgi:hypothetical protein
MELIADTTVRIEHEACNTSERRVATSLLSGMPSVLQGFACFHDVLKSWLL